MIPRILAVEPDRESAHALRRFVQSCVEADVLVVDSAAAARLALDQFGPQIVLVSARLTPDDDVDLTSYIRSHASGQPLPILSVPAMGGGDDEAPAPRGLLRLIASSGTLADGPRTMLARQQAALRHTLQVAVAVTPAPVGQSAVAAGRHARAPRMKGANIPWLTRVTMPLGLEVELLDISRSGLLIASRGQFVVGQPAAFELHGRIRVVVPGRFVRATGDSPDASGLYRAAASFDDDVPLFARMTARHAGAVAVTTELTEILGWVRGQARSGLRADRIRAAFELGVQELVGARDVHVCDVPVRAEEPGDSMCLPVPTSDGSDAFLQAIYDPTRPPSPVAFQRLKAAATLAADVLEIEYAARAAEPAR